MAVQQNKIFEMHQVAFAELACASLLKQKTLHPGRAVRRTPRPLIQPADRLLRREEAPQHGLHPESLNLVSYRIGAMNRMPCQRNTPPRLTYRRVAEMSARLKAVSDSGESFWTRPYKSVGW